MSETQGTENVPELRLPEIRTLRVEVVSGPDASLVRETTGDGALAVGTSDHNDMVLSDPTVSRYHVELRRTPEGIGLRDLGSKNGTLLGSARIREATIAPGTELRLGRTTLRVGDGAPAQQAADLDKLPDVPGLVAESAAMRSVVRTLQKLAQSTVPVLIQGETGTGKEVAARALHALSARREGPFEVIDCGSMPSTLIASELFGHERGAFTGADRQHRGAFERAHGGTLFLDEIGELPLNLQPSLLGVLERGRFRRVGGNQDTKCDVRVLSATNRDLRAEANAGTFRPDLYFRLAVTRVVLPPLRDRPADIDALIDHFLRVTQGENSHELITESERAILRAHPFGGNVRELRNLVEAAVALGGLTMRATNLKAAAASVASPEDDHPPLYREARAAAIHDFERSYLTRLIESCNGNASEASRRAKMDRPYLLSLLKRHGLR